MWRLMLFMIAILQSYYLVYSKNATPISEPKLENCTDPNAERRFDNASCVATCHRKTLSENPAFCFGRPILTEGCYCKQYYYLDEGTGICVHPEKCPCNTARHEFSRYSNECAEHCATLHTLKYCPGSEYSSCWCAYDYCRNDNGTCIRKE